MGDERFVGDWRLRPLGFWLLGDWDEDAETGKPIKLALNLAKLLLQNSALLINNLQKEKLSLRLSSKTHTLKYLFLLYSSILIATLKWLSFIKHLH
jgi:hypothetical protein